MTPPSLRILVCCHKPTELMKDAVYLPIHCGRATMGQAQDGGTLTGEEQQWMLEHTIGDDTGENISGKNSAYSELTAHYWARHNYETLGNPDYIGFIHYRRGFLLSASARGGEIASFPVLTPELCALIQNTSRLRLGYYELYAPERVSAYQLKATESGYRWTQKPPVSCKVIEKNPGNLGLSTAVDYVHQHYQQHTEGLRRYLHGRWAFQWNMFIMRRELFFSYTDYIFDVLHHVDAAVDSRGFSGADKRFLGYVGEHLTGAWIDEARHHLPTRYIPTYFIRNTAPSPHSKHSTERHVYPLASRLQLRFLQIKRILTFGDRRRHYTNKITSLEGKVALSNTHMIANSGE